MKLIDVFKLFDYFGVSINFNFKSRHRYQSFSGGLIFILYLIISSIYVLVSIINFIKRENLTVTSYKKELSQTDEFNLELFNSQIAIGMNVENCQKEDFGVQFELFEAFNIEMIHYSILKENGTRIENNITINLERCQESYFDENLLEYYKNNNLSQYYCMKNRSGLIRGIYTDNLFEYYKIEVAFKNNESMNDIYMQILNKCECKFEVFYKDVAIDPYDYKNPIKSYMNEFYQPVSSIEQVKSNFFVNIKQFDSYENWFFNNKKTQKYGGMSKIEQYSTYKGREKYTINIKNKLSIMFLRIDTKRDIIIRHYQKFTEFLAEMSSLYTSILVFINFIMTNLNLFYARQDIIKDLILYGDEDNERKKKFKNEYKKMIESNQKVKTLLIGKELPKAYSTKFKFNLKHDKQCDDSSLLELNNNHPEIFNMQNCIVPTCIHKNQSSSLINNEIGSKNLQLIYNTNKINLKRKVKTINKKESNFKYTFSMSLENKTRANRVNSIQYGIIPHIINKICYSQIKSNKDFDLLNFGKDRLINLLDVFNYIKLNKSVNLLTKILLNSDERKVFNFLNYPTLPTDDDLSLFYYITNNDNNNKEISRNIESFWSYIINLKEKINKTSIENRLNEIINDEIKKIINVDKK